VDFTVGWRQPDPSSKEGLFFCNETNPNWKETGDGYRKAFVVKKVALANGYPMKNR